MTKIRQIFSLNNYSGLALNLFSKIGKGAIFNPYSSAPTITDGLLLWYKFNSNLNDASGNNATLTTDIIPNYEQIEGIDYATFCTFADDTNYILNIPTTISKLSCNSFTWSFEIKTDINPSASYLPLILAGKMENKTDDSGYSITLHKTGILIRVVNGTSTDSIFIDTTILDQWYNVQFTFEMTEGVGGIIKTYVNEVLFDSSVVTNWLKPNFSILGSIFALFNN